MAEQVDLFGNEGQNFQRCNRKLLRLVFRDTEEFRTEVNLLLDELNSSDFSIKFVSSEEVGALLRQCCYLIPLKHELLVTKLCHFITILASRQQMIFSTGVETVTEYLVEALHTCPSWSHGDILRALAAIVYENGGRLSKFYGTLLGQKGLLAKLATSDDQSVQLGAAQSIENMCIKTGNYPYLSEELQNQCLHTLLRVLQTPKTANGDELLHCRLLITGLRGIQSILTSSRACPTELLGPLLAAIKVHLLNGLPGAPTYVPPTLNPTLTQPEPSPTKQPKPEAVPVPAAKNTKTQQQQQQGAKPQSKGKKKKRTPTKNKQGDAETTENLEAGFTRLNVSGDAVQVAPQGGDDDLAAGLFARGRVSSSESEYSDTEGGQGAKVRSLHSKARQCALGCFHSVIKNSEKRNMFGYWSAFIPDTPSVGAPPQNPTLFTSILKDPVPKARTGALAVLNALLEGSKQYLMAAEDSDQYRNAPFTPFSVTVGFMVKEIHRCLLLALASETSPLAITQIIKCLATLVPNVPYQRLKPGLLTRIVKQIKPFLSHRDPNIRVACLTCLGSIVSIQAKLLEVGFIMKSSRPPTRLSESVGVPSEAANQQAESGYHNNMSDISEGATGGVVTPSLSSGSRTPSLSDQALFGQGGEVPWLVKLCVKNVAAHLLAADPGVGNSSASPRKLEASPRKLDPPLRGSDLQPLPVRLESLQLLTHLAKNHFGLVSGCLLLMRDLILGCLADPDPSVQLHGAKLLEEIGSSLLSQTQDLKNEGIASDLFLVEELWLPVLSGPLPTAIQNMTYHAVRSTSCDCLSNIGPAVFEKLPMDKRIMCLTLLLGTCSDEDHHVRAAAVRALGVYVLYPCLREDVSFMADVANAIITALEEQNLNVRAKAAWSLGNLSDALVLNRNDKDEMFMEDFADMLLLKLLEIATKGSQDNDKVRSNAVRALGNILRYLPERSYKSSRFTQATENAIYALIKNLTSGTMKVRWNACYAVGNMFRNTLLPLGSAPWTAQVLTALTNVVHDCKNFKVRINAAMALSVPASRSHYGNVQQFAAVWNSLILALKSTEEVNDYTEYKYRDNLVEQVCGTVCHMICLIEVADLTGVGTVLKPYSVKLCNFLNKYRQSLSSSPNADKEKAFESAEAYVTQLEKPDDELSDSQREAIKVLTDIVLTKGVDEKPPVTFLETYD